MPLRTHRLRGSVLLVSQAPSARVTHTSLYRGADWAPGRGHLARPLGCSLVSGPRAGAPLTEARGCAGRFLLVSRSPVWGEGCPAELLSPRLRPAAVALAAPPRPVAPPALSLPHPSSPSAGWPPGLLHLPPLPSLPPSTLAASWLCHCHLQGDPGLRGPEAPAH